MAVKPYFEDNSQRDIERMKQCRFQTKRNITDRIDDLEEGEAGIIGIRIIPAEFTRNTQTEEEAAHRWLKYGNYYPITQPTTEEAALKFRAIPLTMRQQALEDLRDTKNPEDCTAIGLRYQGIQPDDKRPRRIALVKTGKAHRLLSYAASIEEPIIKHTYRTALAEKQGAIVLCSVPSHRKGVADYQVRLSGVPFYNGTEKRALVWNIDSTFPEHAPMNVVADVKLRGELSNAIDWSPQSIASFFAFTEQQLQEHNLTPLEMNPFVIFSKEQAKFALKLANQVLVHDFGTRKLRKPYEAEQSWLLMQRAIRKGHDATLYWDQSRDGKISNYPLQRSDLYTSLKA